MVLIMRSNQVRNYIIKKNKYPILLNMGPNATIEAIKFSLANVKVIHIWSFAEYILDFSLSIDPIYYKTNNIIINTGKNIRTAGMAKIA